jgi:hypothetical protein
LLAKCIHVVVFRFLGFVVSKVLADLANGVALLAETVAELADANREDDLAALIAGRSGFGKAIVLDALTGAHTDAAAAICRIAGLSLNSYSAILRMRVRKRRQVVDPYPLLAAYRQTATASLEELIRAISRSGKRAP